MIIYPVVANNKTNAEITQQSLQWALQLLQSTTADDSITKIAS